MEAGWEHAPRFLDKPRRLRRGCRPKLFPSLFAARFSLSRTLPWTQLRWSAIAPENSRIGSPADWSRARLQKSAAPRLQILPEDGAPRPRPGMMRVLRAAILRHPRPPGGFDPPTAA